MDPITLDLLKQAFPRNSRGSVNQDLVNTFNEAALGDHADVLRENFLGYLDVLQEGKFKIDDYLSAVKYVSYKLMGKTNRLSYALTFPSRYNRLMADPTLCDEIDSYVTAYNKNKLVNLILGQSLVPSYVLNQDLYQKALNVQTELMLTAKSELVRSQAANAILIALKTPEAAKLKVDVNIKHDNSIEQLRDMMGQVAEEQLKMINNGVPLNAITQAKLPIEGEVIDVE